MTMLAPRRLPLTVGHVAKLRTAVGRAEESLLFAPGNLDPEVEAIRASACELVSELLILLQRLSGHLAPQNVPQGPAIASVHPEPELPVVQLARLTASSGVVHVPKPNGRGEKLTETRRRSSRADTTNAHCAQI